MSSSLVSEFWNIPAVRGEVLVDTGSWVLGIDPSMGVARRVRQVVDSAGTHHIAVRPDVAEALGIRTALPQSQAQFDSTLTAAGEPWEDWELVFYLPQHVSEALLTEESQGHIRLATPADARAFAEFQELNSEEDLDEADVQLDHLLAVVAWDSAGAAPRIAAAASVYLWDNSALADIGIITAPPWRGRGLAAHVVRATAAHILRQGIVPQYRCQVTHSASRATALSAGFEQFCTWRAVTGGERRDSPQ